MSSNRFTLLLAIFFLLVINLPLNLKLIELVKADPGLSWGFIVSLPLFFIAVFFLIFWFFTFPRLLKAMSILVVMVSTLVSYSMFNYGIVFDYSMIQNVFETNYGEASSYLNGTLIAWIVGMGVLPSVVIARAKIHYRPWLKEAAHKLLGISGSVAVIALIALFYFKDYSAFGRNNSFLSKMIIPTEYLASSYKYVSRNLLTEPPSFQPLGTDAKVTRPADQKPELMVLVLGETARAQNFQLDGYRRDTNRYTSELDLVAVQSVSSCGTATAISVPCMFSRMSKDSFDDRLVRYQDSLIDVFQHAGIGVRWLENDGGCKGVCDRTETWTYTADTDSPWCVNEFCDDLILLDEFDRAAQQLRGGNAVIVLHANGSHGPTYFERYGEEFRVYTPDCQRSDIQNCSNEEIVNTYDNTILHTEYLIAELINRTRQLADDWNTSVVYISDHGESLGENGVYLHGMPYSLAPVEQTQVPWLFWFSDQLVQSERLDLSCVGTAAQQGQYSHDYLFDTLLGLMNVSTQIYRPELDLLAGCRS